MGSFLLGAGDHEDAFSLEWLRDVPVWKAHVAVLDEPWRGTAPPRAMVVVMGEGNVVHNEVLGASAVRTPDAAARVLGDAVHAVAAMAKGYPQTLLVAEWAISVRLAAELDSHDVNVRVSPSLREVRQAIRHLATLLDVPDVAEELLPLSEWDEAGTDPRPAGVLFHAAARFWRARPWERVGEGEAFLARWRGRESVVALTQPRGHGHVVTLFTSLRDYESSEVGSPERAVLGIRFADRAAVPRALRRQIAALGWEVAGPDAHPLLLGAGPATHDRVAPDDVHHLAAVLHALAAWTETQGAARSALPFTDAESGVELCPETVMDAAVPWPPMKRARPACATGPAAAPRAALRGAEAERVDAFAAHLRASGAREATARRDAAQAAEWARFLDGHARLPAEAVTEYDLRLFLYDWYPLHGVGSEQETERLPVVLRRYFRWLKEHEGIEYPWAGAVLRERDAYRERLETAPLGRDPDADADAELAQWRRWLYQDLDARVLLRDRGFPDPTVEWWERPRTPRVAALVHELQRLWLIWRDEEVAAGRTSPERLRAALRARQREWERMPHPDHGTSPIRVAAEDDDG